jgi:hypothetical protein
MDLPLPGGGKDGAGFVDFIFSQPLFDLLPFLIDELLIPSQTVIVAFGPRRSKMRGLKPLAIKDKPDFAVDYFHASLVVAERTLYKTPSHPEQVRMA